VLYYFVRWRKGAENIWTEEGGSDRSWRKLHNEELHNLYSALNIITMLKFTRMRWALHAARMGEKLNAYRIVVVK
jgi:hypothetical protein